MVLGDWLNLIDTCRPQGKLQWWIEFTSVHGEEKELAVAHSKCQRQKSPLFLSIRVVNHFMAVLKSENVVPSMFSGLAVIPKGLEASPVEVQGNTKP